MLITDKKILENYVASKHLWLGIPSIEVTKKGRTFLTFYSGSRRPSGLRKTTLETNSLAHRTTWLRSDLLQNIYG